MGRSQFLVAIPCYNEDKTIGDVVRESLKYAHVAVIDDGSTDASAPICRALGAEVISTGGNAGYEGGIEIALKLAYDRKYDFLITIDADGEHDPKFVKDFVELFSKSSVNLICGIRERPQRFAEWVVCRLAKYLFGVDDILCGMKGYSRETLTCYFKGPSSANYINTAPALSWLENGGTLKQIKVFGKIREDSPRFASRLRANLTIFRLVPPLISSKMRSSKSFK